MCVALYIPKNKTVSEQRLQEAYNANPDGWGLMLAYVDILHNKGIGDFEEFLKSYNLSKKLNEDTILHFRTASSGGIDPEYCHPHFVNKNLAFVQNGNLFEFSNYMPGRNDSKTDIQRFNDEVLKKLPDNFLHIPEIRQALEKYNKECFSKMIFMDNEGNVDIINESAGEWVDGVWFSNGGIENYTGYGYSGAYYYNADDVRHKGGLISIQMFSEEYRKKWDKCSKCQGYFRHEQLLNGRCQGCNTLNELLVFTKGGKSGL